MRVLIYSHFFPPNVGGVETYARLLSEGLAKQTGSMGREQIEVTVVTHTPAESGYDSQFSFPVVRRPGHFRLLKLIRSATVVQLAGPSLLPMLFAFLFRIPFVIEQHGYQAVCQWSALVRTHQGSVSRAFYGSAFLPMLDVQSKASQLA
jgi:glycosyltransferase involved in cell wall biosynthesis